MKRLLIPSDFTQTTLDVINTAAEHFAGEKISIVLFHAFELPDSDAHVMMYATHRQTLGLVPDDFRRACRKIVLGRTNVKDINIRYFYGSTPYAFGNFLEGNKIDAIISPDNLHVAMIAKNSIPHERLIARSQCPVISQLKGLISPVKLTAFSSVV